MRNLLLALAGGLAACAGPAAWRATGEVVLTVEGKVERGPHTFARDDLAKLPRRGFDAVAPGSGRAAHFEGPSASALLGDAIELQPEADLAVFHGDDGRIAAVPLASVRQLRPALAPDGGALRLAWPDLEFPWIESDPRLAGWWLGGVRRIEVQNWIATWGKALRVPTGASEDARLGAEVLSEACLGCHRVRGAGGTRGPELTGAVPGRDPRRFGGSMREHLATALGPASPELPAAAGRQVAAFLAAVELDVSRPEDEPKAPEGPPALPPPAPGGRP